jgi:hypothetical protein
VDAAEVVAVDVRHVVVPRQALVDVAVVRGDELHHAAVLAQLARHERTRLIEHGAPEVLVELGNASTSGTTPAIFPSLSHAWRSR